MAEVFDLSGSLRVTGLTETLRGLTQVGGAAESTAASLQHAESAAMGLSGAQSAASATAAGLAEAQAGATAAGAAFQTQQTANGSALAALAARVAQASTDFKAGEINAGEYAAAVRNAAGQAQALSRAQGVARIDGEAFQTILAAQTTSAGALTRALGLISNDVKQAQVAFKTGVITAQEYALSLAAARNEAGALARGAGQLAGGDLRLLNTILNDTEVSAGHAHRGLGTLRSTAATLVSQMAGVKTSVGQVAGALGNLALGGAVTVGILGGIAAIGFAYDKLTAKSRAQEEAVDKLRQAWKDLNDEQNRGADAARAVAEKDAAALRTKLAEAERALAVAQALPTTVNRGQLTGTANRTQSIQEAEAALDKARRASRAADAALAEDDARREVAANDTITASLIRLVAAHRATAAQTAQLRQIQSDTRRELDGITGSYAKTADGLARAATLTERLSSIEQAFNRETKDGTKATHDAVAAAKARIDLRLEEIRTVGVTTAGIAALAESVRQLDAVQKRANLTDAEQLALLKARNDALDVLAKATSVRGTAARFQPALPKVAPPTLGGLDASLIGPQPSLTERFGRFGADAAKAFSDALALGFRASGQRVQAAIDESIVGPIAARADILRDIGQRIGDGLRDGLSAGIVGAAAALATGHGSVLLGALGSIFQQMGAAMVSAGVAMLHLLPALSNPFTSGPALIAAGAIIAGLGAALAATATGSGRSAGVSRGGAASAATTPIIYNYTIGSSALAAQGASQVVPVAPVTVHQTIIGPNDPAAQRAIALMVTKAGQRGAA